MKINRVGSNLKRPGRNRPGMETQGQPLTQRLMVPGEKLKTRGGAKSRRRKTRGWVPA